MPLQPCCPLAEPVVVAHTGRVGVDQHARSPEPGDLVRPRVDLARLETEVEAGGTRHLGRATDEDERVGAFGVHRRELDARHRAERGTEQHRAGRVAAVDHREHVACELRQCEPVAGCGRVIREAGAPAVERHDTRAGGHAAHEVLERRLFERDFHLTDQRRDQHDRDRALTEGRVGDRHAVVGPCVLHLRAKHGVTVGRSRHQVKSLRGFVRDRVSGSGDPLLHITHDDNDELRPRARVRTAPGRAQGVLRTDARIDGRCRGRSAGHTGAGLAAPWIASKVVRP